MTNTNFIERVAAAPISWGICEAPGWGLQLPVDRVLGEARQLGITAMEQGALGWLPTDPDLQSVKLAEYGMQLLGGFVPLVMYDPAQRDDMLASAEQVAANMEAAGGSYFVTAAVGSLDDWFRPDMTEAAWDELFDNLDRVEQICRAHGLTQVVHPHVDTLIETADEFEMFLARSTVKFCFDTGHLTIGGADVVAIAEQHADRIGIVHLKDVDADVAARERSGELDLMLATREGLFPSIGDGIVRIAEVVAVLESNGYEGWYVMETDVALTEGEPPLGEGPMLGVARSLTYLRSLVTAEG
jgi:inosose dehydratase